MKGNLGYCYICKPKGQSATKKKVKGAKRSRYDDYEAFPITTGISVVLPYSTAAVFGDTSDGTGGGGSGGAPMAGGGAPVPLTPTAPVPVVPGTPVPGATLLLTVAVGTMGASLFTTEMRRHSKSSH